MAEYIERETAVRAVMAAKWMEYKAYCTVCNKPNKQYQPPFCPHCGAKMDGGADHAAD